MAPSTDLPDTTEATAGGAAHVATSLRRRFSRSVAGAGIMLLAAAGAVVAAPSASSAPTYAGTMTVSDTSPTVGESVTFTAEVRPDPRAYRFWFGDDSYEKFDGSPSVSKTYTRPGTYTAVLDAADAGVHHRDLARVTVTVRPANGGAGAPAPAPAPDPAPGPGPSPSARAGGAYVPYAADSFFRSTVAGAPVDAAATSAFHRFMRTHPDQRDTPYPVIRGVDGNQWGTAYAEGSASDPVWRLTGSVPDEVKVLRTQGFHAPAWFGDMLTGTSDSPFVVMDRATGWSVWGAKSKVVGERLISVGAAGLSEHASNGLDRRNPMSDSDLNFRSRGAIPDAMVIRKDLLDQAVATDGDLGHVLHLFIVESNSAAGFVHPMVGNESENFGFGAQGQRIAIAPDVDLAARGLSPEGLAVARTLQRHGAYIGDNSGSTTALKAEQENGVRSVWDGRLTADSLRGLTWDDFVVLPAGWQG